MPPITDPFGDPIDLPNLPLPDFSNPSLYPEPEPAPTGGEPTEPGDKGQPDAPVDIPAGDEAEETASDRWLMGVLVEVTGAPSSASGFQTSAGFVYTSAAFVYQGAGDELEYYEESQRLLGNGQYFPAKKGYDTWRIVNSPFYTTKVTPYYKEKDD
jgi:hypothetical protein